MHHLALCMTLYVLCSTYNHHYIINWWNDVTVCKHFLCCNLYLYDSPSPPPMFALQRHELQLKDPAGPYARELHVVEVCWSDRCVTKAVRLLANCRCHGNKATSQRHDLLVGGLLRRQQDVKDWEQIYFVQLWYEIQFISIDRNASRSHF